MLQTAADSKQLYLFFRIDSLGLLLVASNIGASFFMEVNKSIHQHGWLQEVFLFAHGTAIGVLLFNYGSTSAKLH